MWYPYEDSVLQVHQDLALPDVAVSHQQELEQEVERPDPVPVLPTAETRGTSGSCTGGTLDVSFQCEPTQSGSAAHMGQSSADGSARLPDSRLSSSVLLQRGGAPSTAASL